MTEVPIESIASETNEKNLKKFEQYYTLSQVTNFISF
jgi:hypothetical protein